jgi:hypothetical protein
MTVPSRLRTFKVPTTLDNDFQALCDSVGVPASAFLRFCVFQGRHWFGMIGIPKMREAIDLANEELVLDAASALERQPERIAELACALDDDLRK